jgi:TolB-like protein
VELCRIVKHNLNMRAKCLFFLIFGLGVALAHANGPQPLTVAVYDFTTTPDTSRDLGAKVTALVTADLSSETNLALIERAQLSKALSEQAFGLSGMVNSEVAAKIGQITGAKVLVTGQILRMDDQHIAIIANVIGTETARLFAVKVEGGSSGDLVKLTAELADKIAKTISEQEASLLAAPSQTREERVEKIVKSIQGTNRPTVFVSVVFLRADAKGHSVASEDELGAILLKAGFPVVDQNSEQKPDLVISGVANYDVGTKHGELYTCAGETELKVVERKTGRVIAFERQESTVTDSSKRVANRAVQANAMDGLAERILPLLAK